MSDEQPWRSIPLDRVNWRLLDRIEQHMATANNLRAGREKAFADREAMRAERDACHKAARHAEAEAAELRRASDSEIERLRAALQNLTTKMGAQKAVTGREFSITVEVALRSARAALSPLTAKENKP